MLLLFSLIFFALVFVFSIRPGSITLWIGKIINPLFLLFLGVLIVTALLHPSIKVSAAVPDASYQNGAFFSALSQGYETMDAIAGLAFGIVVISVIRQMGVREDSTIAKEVLHSGMLAGLLSLVSLTGLVSADSPTYVVLDSIRGAVFFFLPVFMAMACAKRLNKLISFDPNLRLPLWRTPDEARKQMLWGLAQADVVKLSAEEAAFLFFTGPENAAEKILNEFGAALVYVTCGAEGCVYQNKKARGRVPALSGLNIVDTTGAGDIFAGAAMFRLLRSGKAPGELDGAELADIVRFACAAAGLSATRPGGISSIPEYEEISALA